MKQPLPPFTRPFTLRGGRAGGDAERRLRRGGEFVVVGCEPVETETETGILEDAVVKEVDLGCWCCFNVELCGLSKECAVGADAGGRLRGEGRL